MANSRATPTLVVTIVVFVLASVFVALRFVSRVGVVRKVVSHDYLILLAWVCSLPFCANSYTYISQGNRLWIRVRCMLWYNKGSRITPAKRSVLIEYGFEYE